MSDKHTHPNAPMSWLRATLPIAAIFAFRMLGLFMLIPVFTLYAQQLSGATPLLIGVALGGYGLTQGLLQIPFGLLSDYFGRKPIICAGLIFFALGSLIGMYAHSITWMIVARALQGAGAIGSVLIALLADLTADNVRVKSMAILGITIGFSFGIAIVISPWIAHTYGLSGIFGVTLLLAIMGLILLYLAIPTPSREPFTANPRSIRQNFIQALTNRHLQRLNISIFLQHLLLTSTFFIVPMQLKQYVSQGYLATTWHFYLPLMLGSFITMLPVIRLTDKQYMRQTFLCAVGLIAITQFSLSMISISWVLFCIALFCYFIAFNILEAALPSMVSRQADPRNKGTAMGIYSSSQFLGIFVGGLLSGVLFEWFNGAAIFIANGLIACLWLLLTQKISPNQYEWTLTMMYTHIEDEAALQQALSAISGVTQVHIDHEKQTIYLRINQAEYQAHEAQKTFHMLHLT